MTRVLCVARDRASQIIFEALVHQAGLGVPSGPLKPLRSSVVLQQVLAYLRQVDGHCRSEEQLLRVLGAEAVPPLTPERLKAVLADMQQQRLLDRQGRVYQPASEGWQFIESSRIYSNIEPAPLETTLVDADSGHVVATVAGIGGTHVRVAGRSYELLKGARPHQRKVRAVDATAGSPRYHSRTLPYAADLGLALANHLGIATGTLAVVPRNGTLVVMTWLGRLLNMALPAALKGCGGNATAGVSSLGLTGISIDQALSVVREAVAATVQLNPLSRLKVEQVVDVGPYFELLSPALQQAARCDWLDRDYLQRWATQIERVQNIDPDTALGRDLLAVA